MSRSTSHRQIGFPLNFQDYADFVSFVNIELRVSLEVPKGREASSLNEAGTEGFLYVLRIGFRHPHFL